MYAETCPEQLLLLHEQRPVRALAAGLGGQV